MMTTTIKPKYYMRYAIGGKTVEIGVSCYWELLELLRAFEILEPDVNPFHQSTPQEAT